MTRSASSARSVILRLAASMLVGVAVASCTGGESTSVGTTPDSTATLGPPGLGIVSGANVSDTIEAVLPQPLKVVVRDAGGRPVPKVQVRFQTIRALLPGSFSDLEEERVHLVGSSNGSISTYWTDSTGADGIATARVRLGRVVGSARLEISVDQSNLVDTAFFEVMAGAIAGVRVAPRDSAFTIGGTLALRATALDRASNPRGGTVTFRAIDPGIAASTSGVVSANAAARARVEASSGAGAPDVAWVSVVPPGRFAARFNGALSTQQMDGSGRRVIQTAPLLSVDPVTWSRDGQSLLVRLHEPDSASALYRAAFDGTATVVLPKAPTPVIKWYIPNAVQAWSPMADGSLLTSINECGNAVLYRFPSGAPNPATRLSPTVPYGHNDCYDTFQSWPSPSPDGTRFVYQNDSAYNYPSTLEMMSLPSGVATQLRLVGRRPSWSPIGDLISFFDADQIWVVKPDGTGRRAVSPPGHHYLPGASWSPDGRWILARIDGTNPELAILEVATGLELPLDFTRLWTNVEYGEGTWSPVP